MSEEFPPPGSLWLDAPLPTYQHSLEPVDVAVIGAGIAGITTAYLLKQAGYTVALLEARRLLNGTTGHTTAKVTTQHGTLYGGLSPESAKLYAKAQKSAFYWLRDEISDLGIECDYEIKNSYLYIENTANRNALISQSIAQHKASIISEYIDTIPEFPINVAGAIKAVNQAQFNPVKWLSALAERIDGNGSYITENTIAKSVSAVSKDNSCIVYTDKGNLSAKHIVIATQAPFNDHGIYTEQMTTIAEQVVCGPVDKALKGIYLSADSGYSIRYAYHNNQPMAIVLGNHHSPGVNKDLLSAHKQLAQWAIDNIGLKEITYRWSGMDYTTPDRIPFIGSYSSLDTNIWVATGFGQWGMTNGTFAGLLLTDLIRGIESPYTELFSPYRPRHKVESAISESSGFIDTARDLSVDESLLKVRDGEYIARGLDSDGKVLELSAYCTHLGCTVAYNNDEQTLDCPCHGSRYSLDGSVIHGPAINPLTIHQSEH